MIISLKVKIAKLQEKIEEQTELRKQIESKKKFETPGKIQFTRRVQVQPLPSSKSQIKPPPIENATKAGAPRRLLVEH